MVSMNHGIVPFTVGISTSPCRYLTSVKEGVTYGAHVQVINEGMQKRIVHLQTEAEV